MIRVGIAENIWKIAETLKEKVELAPDFEVVFIARNGKEVIAKLQNDTDVDVILMDINMPVLNGIEATENISKTRPEIKILMSMVFDEEQNLFDAIMAGAVGSFRKDNPPAKIHKCIYEALVGGVPMRPNTAKKMLAHIQNQQSINNAFMDKCGVNSTEIDVLNLLVTGISYEQISDRLTLSYNRISNAVNQLVVKLQKMNL